MLTQTIVSTKGTRQWQGIPAIERAAGGRLWVSFFSGGHQEPDVANCILLTTSDDDGATWREPEVAVPSRNNTRAFDPCLWHAPDGRLWMFYNLATQTEPRGWVCARTTDHSDAAQPVWSEGREIPLDVPYAFRLNKPTVLASGRWLLPVTWARAFPAEKWFHFDASHLQGVAISDDAGATWRFTGELAAPKWALENMIVERRDGTLWMLIRTGAGELWQSLSDDGGDAWSAPEPAGIVNPGARYFIRRLASGRLLLINTPQPKERTSLYATLSDDDGRTWSAGLLIDDREKISYPDAIEAAPGLIYMVNDRDRYGPGEIQFSRFEEADVLGL